LASHFNLIQVIVPSISRLTMSFHAPKSCHGDDDFVTMVHDEALAPGRKLTPTEREGLKTLTLRGFAGITGNKWRKSCTAEFVVAASQRFTESSLDTKRVNDSANALNRHRVAPPPSAINTHGS
jgi:hypothetical protein